MPPASNMTHGPHQERLDRRADPSNRNGSCLAFCWLPPAGGSGWKSTALGGWIPPEKVSEFKAQSMTLRDSFFLAFLDEKSGGSPVMVGNLRNACNRSEYFSS